MLKRIAECCLVVLLLFAVSGCQEQKPEVKIGASFGVGAAPRWASEMTIMEQRARELGIKFEGRLNKTDKPRTQVDDCRELIDSGISVLILVPRDVNKVDEILSYAKQHNVKVISYARAVMGESVDLFVGYDSYKIGQITAQHLIEKVNKGNIIVLKGDEKDFNTPLFYQGAMKVIAPLVEEGNLRIVLDAFVPGWSAAAARELVKKAMQDNGGRIDAIYAPNDVLAGACAEALEELGHSGKVLITGMDADLAALQRLVKGKQDATIYMDLQGLARTAVDEAHSLATRKRANSNSALDNKSSTSIDAYLINGKLVTRENIDKLIIEPGIVSREAVYAK